MSDDSSSLTLKDLVKSGLGITALVCVVAPFFLHMTSSSSRTVNGEVVAATFRDYPGIAGGALGLLLALVIVLKRDAEVSARATFGAAIGLLAAFHLANGLGVFQHTAAPKQEVAADEPAKPASTCDAKHLDACEKGCAEGTLGDCNDLGSILAEGEGGVKVDQARALELFLKACDGDHALACNNAAFVLRKRVEPADPVRAFPLLEKACKLGKAVACNTAGFMVDHGEGVAENDARALAFFRKACDGGEGMGCKNAGFFLLDGTGGEKSPAQAAALFEKGCTAGEPSACNELGLYLDNLEGEGRDVVKAVAAFKKACDADVAQGCTNLGVRTLHPDGEDAKPDLEAAFTAFEKGCKGDNARGCFEAGLLYDQGKGTEKDAATAFARYEKACELNDVGGCVNAGIDLRDGDGAQQDDDAAEKKFARACTLGEDKGCMLAAKQHALTDVPKAKAELNAICKRGFKPACEQLKLVGKPTRKKK